MKKTELYLKGNKISDSMVADSFFSRFMGLMGKTTKQIEDMGGLLIKPCSQIHMFFMKTPIDAVYLSKDNVVIKIDCSVPTGICCKKVKGSRSVLELPSGTASQLGLKENDLLEVL